MFKFWGSIRSQRAIKVFSKTALLVIVFVVGVGAGQGKINFRRLPWQKRPVQQNLPKDLDYSSAEEVFDSLKESFDGQLDEQKLLDGVKEGLAKAAGDPYTEYLNAAASKEFGEQLNGSFEGIGAELSKEEGSVVIVAPIAGFPAEKAGLRPRDVIAEIDGKSAFDLTVSEAVKRIRGPKGTVVKLTIVRGSEALKFEITRDQIVIPSVKSEILEGNIGYLRITRFGEDTARLSREAATKLKSAKVKGVILDVRGNPGGLLDASVDVSSLWLKDRVVLQEKRGQTVVQTFKSRGTPILLDVPTVVLIDEGSASASEIVAGALKDHKVAKIVGTKSFGKGSVQSLHELGGGSVLKVTIARWYTPNGRNIDQEGIEPDQNVALTADDAKAKRDPQKDAAVNALK